MKILVLIFLLALAGLNTLSEAQQCGTPTCDEPTKCKPESIFAHSDGCNYCLCPSNGNRLQAGCTTMACINNCKPGEMFAAEDSCNVCICPKNGRKSDGCCTNKDCRGICRPEDTFLADDGCNHCICPRDGNKTLAACTKMACPEPRCKPGELFLASDGCNTCECPICGLRSKASKCTKNPCTSGPQCTPGKMYPKGDNCNICMCSKDGKTSCTDKICGDTLETCYPGEFYFLNDGGCSSCICPDSAKREDAICTIENKKCPFTKCPPGQTYIIDYCNQCKCNDDGKTMTKCTNQNCSTTPPKFCDIGDTFMLDECNLCKCMNGYSFQCGNKTCESPETCNPGDRFTLGDGCSSCRCTNTFMRVDAQCNQYQCPIDKKCKPGNIYFPDSCNFCSKCYDNGTLTGCTQKNCPLPTMCTPRKYYRKGNCNTCRCADDGLSMAWCSNITCDSVLTCDAGEIYTLADNCSTCVCPYTYRRYDAQCSQKMCPPEKKCTPRMTYNIDCNYCLCSNDGTYLTNCTSRYCPTPQPGICNPGKVFALDECNTCTCTDGYSYQCENRTCDTIETCHPGRDFLLLDRCTRCECPDSARRQNATCYQDNCPPQKRCKPGTNYLIDACNYCKCNDDRTLTQCTSRICNPTVPPPICIPGSCFPKDRCSLCICDSDGSKYTCENRTCEGIETCYPGENFTLADQCTSCQCSNSARRQNAFCQQNECSPDQKCKPGYAYRPDWCNICTRCFENGTLTGCTTKSCPTTTTSTTTSTPMMCKPGQTTVLDKCNTCKCSDDGMKLNCSSSSCDLIQTCRAGESFTLSDSCSECICPETCRREDAICYQNQCSYDKICRPGTDYYLDSCNYCRCNYNGTLTRCSNKLCPITPQPTICTDGTKFPRDQCNICECIKGYKFECSSKSCETIETCYPGESFNLADGCTRCQCPASCKREDARCEQNQCPPPKKCRPGKPFFIDCNVCQCNFDGSVSNCTQKLCPTTPFPPMCDQGTTYPKDSCSICRCSQDRLRYECDNRTNCETIETCYPGSYFTLGDGCSNCLCPRTSKREEASCTQEKCHPAKLCKPGQYYFFDCNRCYCNLNGTLSNCSNKLCPTAPPPKCPLNSTFPKDDCNICSCSNDGWRCTNKPSCDGVETCYPGNNYTLGDGCSNCMCSKTSKRFESRCSQENCPSEKKCRPGQYYYFDCNRCFCNFDGTLTNCTNQVCPSPTPKYCTPGKCFPKDDCNLCTCSRDGSRFECTSNKCDKGVETCYAGENYTLDDQCTSCQCPESCKREEALCNQDQCPFNKKCRPSSYFYINACNLCRCNENGTVSNCSNKPCPSTPSPKICTRGNKFPKDICNICTCVDDETRYDCENRTCETIETCHPGQIFTISDGCTSCSCPDSCKRQEAICNQYNCPIDKRCKPGEIFFIDDTKCNYCKCNLDRTVGPCTTKTCPTTTTTSTAAPQVCPPGKNFTIDSCNICRCDSKGSRYYCTEKNCDYPEACNHGDTFIADNRCSICTCTASCLRSDAPCDSSKCPKCTLGQPYMADECTYCSCKEGNIIGPCVKKAYCTPRNI